MKILFTLVVLMFVSIPVHAGTIYMPLGGKMSVDTKVWNVQQTNVVTGHKSLGFFHKSLKNLQGYVFDGNIKDSAPCGEKKTAKGEWVTCERKVKVGNEISYQVLSQRMIGPKTYQTYVVSFNYPPAKAKEFEAKIQEFRKTIGGVK